MAFTDSLDLKDKRAVVVGLGLSGVAACRLLSSLGAKVVATDSKKPDAISPEVRALADSGVTLVLGGHKPARMSEADLVVVSPGVPSFPELEAAERAGVPIWGEVELAVRAVNASAKAAGRELPRLVAIGGTNGKSTVTSLVGALLERAHLRTFVGGNLGEPLAAHAGEPFDALVLEVSSFQMERVDAFHPEISVLLNVTPDHLDRYADEAGYANAKGNAFVRQTSEDFAVVPVGDDVCKMQASRGKGRLVTFGPGGIVDVRADAVVDHRARVSYPRATFGLQGGHNALNVAAAVAAVGPFGLDARVIQEVLEGFRGLPHRMVLVRSRDGVRWYDDSKGTNVGASVTAVRGVAEERVVLVAGGRDKGGSYGPLVDALREKGRAAVLIGEAAALIRDAIGDVVPVRIASTMTEAVDIAAQLARPGDAVLLSPACSSFDMFRDYKHRGDVFVNAVLALPGAASSRPEVQS
jgi:UDP-N-acetylmuramoylalanine--D-glutamate ligase